MAEVTERDEELTLSATDGEPLSLEALQRIARAVAKAREEGREGLQAQLTELTDEHDALEIAAAELESRLASSDTERIVAQEECETLRARLARWKPIVRAAATWRELDSKIGGSDEDELADNAELAADALEPIADAVDVLTEQERSEILQGGS